jgi:CBS domain-containing protein
MAPMTVSSIMTSDVITVRPELPLNKLISLLVDENISGVPVVDGGGIPIGMVSKSDLVSEEYDWADLREEAQKSRRRAGILLGEGPEPVDERSLDRRTVGDVMTSAALSVLPTASIREASALMVNHHVHRLTVVDESDRLVGIVTTFDITRWVAAN